MRKKQIHILFTVLNWGLGHATRSIPLIHEFLRQGVKVSLAGEGDSLLLLKSEFPEQDYYTIKGINIKYPVNIPFGLSMLLQGIKIIQSIQKEHKEFNKLVSRIKPDAIFSDNRYGAYAAGIPCVMICHQLQIKTPAAFSFAESITFQMHRKFLKPFSEIWVPDTEGTDNLSGDLSHSKKITATFKPNYIGPLSRLYEVNISDIRKSYDVFAILSGPEPQRSVLEKLLISQLRFSPYNSLIVTGQPAGNSAEMLDNITLTPHLQPEALKFHFIHSKYIICRSGYSTLMDLCAFQRTAIVIPTPGQTEQEYLAQLHGKANHIIIMPQKALNIPEAITRIQKCIPFHHPVNKGLTARIRQFIDELSS